MPRLLFEKSGRAIWISHLDLMRLFQRSFKRADLPLTHTHGFNPRPSVSIALPLSVGVESCCELLDFNLDGAQELSLDEIKNRLNGTLTEGIRVLDVFEGGQKIGGLSYLNCHISLFYDRIINTEATNQLRALFDQAEILVDKKTKSGIQEQNISSMIKTITISMPTNKMIMLDAIICCQNPTLNPAQLVLAVEKFLPDLTPDYSACKRIEIFDKDMNVFR